MSLLLAHAGAYDRAFLEARLEEVRDLAARMDDDLLAWERSTGDIDTRTGYRHWAPTYDDPGNPLIDVEEPVLTAVLDRIPPGRALDLACGTGRTSRLLAERGHIVVGVDSCEAMLERGSGGRAVADISALAFGDASFDLATCTLALTHQPDLRSVLAEAARVLRPGGELVTSDIHSTTLFLGGIAGVDTPEGRFIMPANVLRASDYIGAATAAGLTVVECHEPVWPVDAGGAGGEWTQRVCGAAADACYRSVAAAIIWRFRKA